MNLFMKLFSILFLLLTSTAQAYVPPSTFLIEQTAKKRATLTKGLRIKTRITGTESIIKEVLWFDVLTKKVTGKIFDEKDVEIARFQKKLGDSSVSLQLLLDSNPMRVTQLLTKQGFDFNDTENTFKPSLKRLGNQVGWAIGNSTPSLWILKDEFTPLLLKIRDGSTYEIRFEENKTNRDFPFSRAITLLKSDSFVLKGEVMEFIVNPDLSDLKSLQFSEEVTWLASVSSGTKDLVEKWVQWIR